MGHGLRWRDVNPTDMRDPGTNNAAVLTGSANFAQTDTGTNPVRRDLKAADLRAYTAD